MFLTDKIVEEQFGHLYLPPTPSSAYQTVVLIHGGCWLSTYDLKPMSLMAKHIADKNNVAVWSIEYRRLNGNGTSKTIPPLV
jgi:acetyl esterase/lipase